MYVRHKVITATFTHQVEPLPPRMHWVIDKARLNSSFRSFAFRFTWTGCLQRGKPRVHNKWQGYNTSQTLWTIADLWTMHTRRRPLFRQPVGPTLWLQEELQRTMLTLTTTLWPSYNDIRIYHINYCYDVLITISNNSKTNPVLTWRLNMGKS